MRFTTRIKRVDFEMFIEQPTFEQLEKLENYLDSLAQCIDSFMVTVDGYIACVEVCGLYYSNLNNIVNDIQDIFYEM